ncbi:TATA-binding protein associated factor Taf2 [Drepanopeziza brunnea f. sp. 'multigermtubi' MB_m1]|uniref:Transcription initiation factor TFIID subunit 2 n=1 Tax=Marssonina brunnea f. sp. multigermtubi (strain MB_m1) TaxID=1072389 RepID=K1WKM7_MARBU|nr:TATA-binding protein associated factor Taf2 [Drepanopeziza brunnea f. sp. 'multigermtubi' MB_m1]EKD18205.1 TATA-binding protein associated factor Taf2 [Drepanopeziza brunnea f. sp. 'multigermtubi' MB_m1]
MDAQGHPLGEIVKPEPDYGFEVPHQKVDLEIDFSTQSLTGRCEIVIRPLRGDLTEVRLDARQCVIESGQVTVNGVAAEFEYRDPMKSMDISESILWGVHQADLQKDKLKPMIGDTRSKGPLIVNLPFGCVRLEEVPLDALPETGVTPLALRAVGSSGIRTASVTLDTPLSAFPKGTVDMSPRYEALTIVINFAIHHFRDGLHFVGLTEGDARYPHVYTRHSMDPGTASCIFPCVDDSSMRSIWEVSIKCSRTLGDALKRRPVPALRGHKNHSVKKALTNGVLEDYEVPLSDEEKLLELVVVCTGELTSETTDLEDSSKKIITFSGSNLLAARHIGFAIGPFEQVDLSQFREVEDDEKLGQGQTIPIYAYCLPGRADEVRNTCAPLTHAFDYILMNFGGYAYQECRFVFVDDQIQDTEHAASLSICSTRLLFAEGIIDPEIENIRILVHAIATQWFGVNIVPSQPSDRWVTIGLSHFITGLFMKTLCGNNDYAFRQKTLSDKLVEQDFQRPSLHALGEILGLGSFQYEFMKLKAPLVMFILDKRLVKASGSAGLVRIISKMVMIANTGDAKESFVSTEGFRKSCEKVTKYRQTDSFWKEWVYGSGCPRLSITQKFNKKRLCVELTISQKQDTLPTQREMQKDSFLRELKEVVHDIYSLPVQPVFTGPMTIRIHEADGTPYEHIVEIRELHSKIEIPYNTKYKRLKRTRKQKEQQNAMANADPNAEGGEDTLIYCLGDTIQGPDMEEWGVIEWDAENLAKMELESYEWIRVDADFEWICEKQFSQMPAYMYVSQLQQDRDVVAQQDSMLYLKNMQAHKLVATFLTRTLMDTRYFHGIRSMAAEALNIHASPAVQWVGMKQLEKAYVEFYAYAKDKTPRPNDFSDKRAYTVEMSIIKSLAKIRDSNGNCPKQSRLFLMDILRFNDNSNNQFSDNFKIATLLSALADSLIPLEDADNLDIYDDEEDMEPVEFKKQVLEELDRYARMDEWINSYQNCFTVTVLDCKQRLMQAKVIPTDAVEFVQYLHDGTSEFVRIKAFRSLIDLGFLTNNAVASLLLNVASTDPSPYTRRKLFEIFCLGIASIAFGEDRKSDPVSDKTDETAANEDRDVLMNDAPPVEDGNLLVEQDATAVADARAALIARTKTIEGALLALKNELKSNEVLKVAIWKAVKSPNIVLAEHLDLLDVCHVIYEAVESIIVKLDYPRYWGVSHAGKGKLTFKKTDKVRTKPRKPARIVAPVVVEPPKAVFALPAASPQAVQQPKPVIMKFSTVHQQNKIPQQSKTPTSKTAPPTQAPKSVIKPVVKPVVKSEVVADESMKPPPYKPAQKRERPTDNILSSDDRPRKKRKIVKMKVSAEGMKQIVQITNLPPTNPAPALARAKSYTKSASPAPNRSSPKPSPGPKSSPAHRTGLPSAPAAPRTGLPSGPSAPARNPLPNGSSGPSAIKIKVKPKPRASLPSNPPLSNHSASPRPNPPSQSTPPAPKSTPVSNQKPQAPGSQNGKPRKPLPDAVPRSSPAPGAKKLVIKIKNGKATRQ